MTNHVYKCKKHFVINHFMLNGSRCRFRILDSFGTEPAFNLGSYARRHGYKTQWGSWELQPRQYMTLFRKSVRVCVCVCV